MKVLLLASSRYLSTRHLNLLIGKVDLVVAVDGAALEACFSLHPVHYMIGDLDSLSGSDLDDLRKKMVIHGLPKDKDHTDLRLALLKLESDGATEIHILGATGGRLDHSISALMDARDIQANIYFYDDFQKIFYIKAPSGVRASLAEYQGKTLSIVSLSGIKGLKTNGLKWDFSWDSAPALSISQSNEVLESASIELSEGTAALFVIDNSSS